MTCECEPRAEFGTVLVLIEKGGPDGHGRERFVMHWFEPGRAGTTEMRAPAPGKPSVLVEVCGHRAQHFHAVAAPIIARAAERDTVVVRMVEKS